MTPPRWFFPLVAACLVVLTAATVVWTNEARTAGRYAFIGVQETGIFVLDTRTGTFCNPTGAVYSGTCLEHRGGSLTGK